MLRWNVAESLIAKLFSITAKVIFFGLLFELFAAVSFFALLLLTHLLVALCVLACVVVSLCPLPVALCTVAIMVSVALALHPVTLPLALGVTLAFTLQAVALGVSFPFALPALPVDTASVVEGRGDGIGAGAINDAGRINRARRVGLGVCLRIGPGGVSRRVVIAVVWQGNAATGQRCHGAQGQQASGGGFKHGGGVSVEGQSRAAGQGVVCMTLGRPFG